MTIPPFIVSVIDGSSFGPDAKSRIYKTKCVWANDAAKNSVKALESGNAKEIKQIYGSNLLLEHGAPTIAESLHGASGGLAASDEFSLEGLESALEADTQRQKEMATLSRSRFVAARGISFTRDINIVKDVWVTPDDNLATLKRKIQLATDIPTYRQHLWYEHSGVVFSPCYALYVAEKQTPVNIWDLRKSSAFIFGMPIDTEIHSARGQMRIRNLEFSTTLGSICEIAADARWYVTDLNDFLPTKTREQFAEQLRHDIYMRELVYFSFVMRFWPAITAGVFQVFAINEAILHDEYPEMSISNSLIKRQLTLETSILAANPEPRLDKWPIEIYIEESDISAIGTFHAYGSVINLRNLFDAIRVTPMMPRVECRTVLAGQMHNLVKTLRGGQEPSQKQKVNMETLMIMAIMPNLGELFVHVAASGGYHVRAKWREDARVTLNSAQSHTIEFANPILAMINKFGESVTIHPLMTMTPENIDIIDTSIILVIGRSLSVSDFEALKENMAEMKLAGILSTTSDDANTVIFHMHKGMFKYDDARFDVISGSANGYEYATSITAHQRWEGVYIRQKTSSIASRYADIYIRGSGIKYGEFAAFIKYMLLLVQMPMANGRTAGPGQEKRLKVVSHLKEQDPILYDMKKVYRHRTMYSQLCQKPNQPILVPGPTKKSVKYWNFTKKEPAYYECPSAKFPTFYFKTGVHPAGFCLPCCKKTSLEAGSKREDIFETCLRDHSYTTGVKMTPSSSYIVSYTKTIDPGRLAHLPEASLDQLFYQQYASGRGAVDSECIPKLGYYLYGTLQTIGPVAGLGGITALAHGLGLEVNDFIDQSFERIAKPEAQSTWALVLDGRITSHYKSPADFIGDFRTATGGLGLDPNKATIAPLWNAIFINIARLFWNLNTILFVDRHDADFYIDIPARVKHVNEILSAQHRHIIIVTRESLYWPIYLVDLTAFKTSSTIEARTFAIGDKIMGIMRSALMSIISKHTGGAIDLETLIAFLDDSAKSSPYRLIKAYIDRRNTCYAASVQFADGKHAYIPITYSLHDHLQLERDHSEFDESGYDVPVADVLAFLTAFNKWAQDSAHLDILPIAPSSWLLLGESVIGFRDAGQQFNYYVAPITKDEAKAILPLPFIKIYYSPGRINALIAREAPPSATFNPPIAQCLYDHYAYQLFVLEFVTTINRQRNEQIRKDIARVITERIKTPAIMFHDLRELIGQWADDYDFIVSIFSKFARGSSCGTAVYDQLIGHKKSVTEPGTIIAIIDASRFSFDDVTLGELRAADPATLTNRLEGILSDIISVVDGPVVIDKFPNLFASCQSAESFDYCTAGATSPAKLRISAEHYEQFVAQLARDIKNPLKQKQLMTLVTKTANASLSFTSRPDELIRVGV